MAFFGRTKELGHLRTLLDRREPQIVRVTGLRGGGKTALVRRVMANYDGLVHLCPPLPEPTQRAHLMDRIEGARATRGLAPVDPGAGSDWRGILHAAADVAEDGARPFVLVLDDAHRLGEARARYVEAIVATLHEAAATFRTVHIVLIGPDGAIPSEEKFTPHPTETVSVGPLPLRAAAARLPGSRPEDRVRAYGLFGGIPRVLDALDRTVTVGTNVRRMILDPGGPLSEAASTWLEQDLHTPARYFAIMSALARGEADWSTVHAGVPDLTGSGQVAPYLNRLGELGLVTTRRSLDAGPRSRSTRYSIADPFLAFFFRFVLPYRFPVGSESESEYYSRRIRPVIDEHLAGIFPTICRQHMTHDAIETLGAVAREGGSLWGSECDLPVAGILTSGAAYYGACHWTPPTRAHAPLEWVERKMRETRYGFGRERRLRLIFTGKSVPRWLRRDVARRQDAEVIDAAALVGF
jgi:uncharacterized protein